MDNSEFFKKLKEIGVAEDSLLWYAFEKALLGVKVEIKSDKTDGEKEVGELNSFEASLMYFMCRLQAEDPRTELLFETAKLLMLQNISQRYYKSEVFKTVLKDVDPKVKVLIHVRSGCKITTELQKAD